MNDLVAAFRLVHLKTASCGPAERDAALALLYAECQRRQGAVASFDEDVVEEAASKAFLELWQHEPVDAAFECTEERRVRAFIRRRVRLRCLDVVRKQKRMGEQPAVRDGEPGTHGTLEAGPEDAVWAPAAGEETWWTAEEWEEAQRLFTELVVPATCEAARRKDARARLERCIPELIALHEGSTTREELLAGPSPEAPGGETDRKTLSDRLAQQHRRTRQDLLATLDRLAGERRLGNVALALLRMHVLELVDK